MPIPPPSASTNRPGPVPKGAPAPNAVEVFEPVAAVLAALFPGAGHLYLGEHGRAVLIAVGILGLFFGGLLIGGIDVVDRQEDPIWFVGEALVGPIAFGVDYVHQHRFKVLASDDNASTRPGERGSPERLRSANPGEARDPVTGRVIRAAPGQLPPNTKSLGRMNELGTLFATIAGMLNLIVIIDAAMYSRRGS